MKDAKILTRHPLGKSGRSVDKRDYELFEAAILSALRDRELTHTELVAALVESLKGRFAGNVSWYAMTVKLDLEARKRIRRTAGKPQRYRST